MIELKFKDFRDEKFQDLGYSLYVMRNGENEVLYVGISRRSIWERWFSSIGYHMCSLAPSPVGRKVIDNFPASLEWTIELWTIVDCLAFLPERKHRDLRFLEEQMIAKLHPITNIMLNYAPERKSNGR